MQIINNKALLMRLKEPVHVLASVRKAHRVSDHEVLVKWDLDTVHRLRGLGLKAPSPIEGQYKWPGQFRPMTHQKSTAAFLTLNQRAFCFSEQGTGKTSSAIWAADYLLQVGYVRRVLVICPVSIMDVAWRADLFSCAMHRTVAIAHGTAEKRRKILAQNTEFVIINFDGVEVVKDEIAKGGFDLIIIDEGNAYKNAQSKRWKTLGKILQANPDAWLWLMTGTPAAQGPEDAYGLAKLVNPRAVPRTMTAFRDMVMFKVSQFKWEPRPESTEIVHRVLQPAIRFTKDECLDLPDLVYVKRAVELTKQQHKFYEILRKDLLMQASGSTVSAVNSAVGMNKLLQVSCISTDTPVLCARGWVPIQEVTPQDLVWDGVEWVSCGGAIRKGVKQTMKLDGVEMTEDHLVLTTSGWKTAKDCIYGNGGSGFERESVRIPEGGGASRDERRPHKKGNMALPMRLRSYCSARVAGVEVETPTERKALRLPHREVEYNPRDVIQQGVRNMVEYAPALQQPTRQRLQKLRGAWGFCVRAVEQFVRVLLGRHGGLVPRGAHLGPSGQQRPVQPGELSMGDCKTAKQEHAGERLVRHAERPDDCSGSGRKIRAQGGHAPCTTSATWSESGTPVQVAAVEVFDILNCGPRNRFVVRGDGGQHLIVHNCGAVYDDEGGVLEFNIGHRYNVLKEVIDEAAKKTLVFVPYTHVIDVLVEKLRADGYAVGVIRGDVPLAQRTELIQKFQREKAPEVLVIQPQSAAHGVTLTAADTVVWWSPVSSLEIYAQANARVHRSGQTHKCTIVQMQGSPVERKLYGMLDRRVDVHTKLVDLYKEVLD
jgi:mannitol/fructose-specific phosphotransferase system IIA component